MHSDFQVERLRLEVINRKRAISKTHARDLASFFHVSPNVFI
jgi:antitoxin component HigA of HigAB toxin-antitoxin module